MTQDSNRYYVYAHRRNDTGEPFYVGKGCRKRARSQSGRNKHWKNIVAKHGYTVEIVADGLTEAEAFEREKKLIADYRAAGHKLTNRTDGGEGRAGYIYTPEQRAAQGERNRQRFAAPEARAAVGERTRQRLADPIARAAHRVAMANRNMQHSWTDEARAAAAEQGRQRFAARTPEQVANELAKRKATIAAKKAALTAINILLLDMQQTNPLKLTELNWRPPSMVYKRSEPRMKDCAYCGKSFIATDPRSLYCCPSHRVLACVKRKKARIATTTAPVKDPAS